MAVHIATICIVMMKTINGTLGVLKFLGNIICFERSKKNNLIESAFSGRAHLTTEDFYSRFFKTQGVPFHIVEGVRRILSEQLDADMSRLHDEDDFSKNLDFFWEFDSMADVEIICALEKEFGINITDEEAENTHTVKDIVLLVARKV